jgi:ABC-type enterochelin transport system substrate-binding protein
MISKIEAKIEGEQIEVSAKFYLESDAKFETPIHEINTAFPLETSPEEIKEAVEKAGALFESEQAQKEKQAEIDKAFNTAKETVNKLNS